MLNFALGPVMSSDLVLKVGSEQTPYFRTPEFSKITLENEKLMKEMLFADEDSKVIFLTGTWNFWYGSYCDECFYRK